MVCNEVDQEGEEVLTAFEMPEGLIQGDGLQKLHLMVTGCQLLWEGMGKFLRNKLVDLSIAGIGFGEGTPPLPISGISFFSMISNSNKTLKHIDLESFQPEGEIPSDTGID